MKILLFLALVTTHIPAKLEDGRCSHCVLLGERSTVEMNGWGECTAMYCGGGHYDEDGAYVAPRACNTCTFAGRCSRGHDVISSEPSL